MHHGANLTETTSPPNHKGLGPGRVALRDTQVLKHMHMVHAAASRFRRSLPQHVEGSDLVSAGTVGLIEAVQRYNSCRDASFSTFAFTRIKGAMLDFLRESDWAPRDLRRRERTIEAAVARCTSALARVPSEEEIAQELGWSLDELQQSLAMLDNLQVGSLQTAKGESSQEKIAFVIDSQEPGALIHCLRSELRMQLTKSIDSLPERERLVLALACYEGLRDQQIAEVMDVSASRVAQLRAAAILKLRVLLHEYTIGRVTL